MLMKIIMKVLKTNYIRCRKRSNKTRYNNILNIIIIQMIMGIIIKEIIII